MEVKVDGRVELMSILFHLAGTKEYQSVDTPYSRAVDARFAQWKEHPAVVASRELRENHGISYNAPIGLAVFLDKNTLLPLARLAGAEELDERWNEVPIRPYLDKVRDFATVANVSGFFAEQRAYIDQVEKRLATALVDEKIEEWFSRVLVAPARAALIVVPGLLTGPWNYEAASHDSCGRRWVYQIVELEGVDAKGLPKPTHTTTELVAHELAHGFVNPVVEQHEAALVAAAQPLFERARPAMEKQHYGTAKIMIEESVVRAIASFFARDRLGAEAASQLVHDDVARGFTWNIELAGWLATQKSPLDLEALAPALTKWFAETAARPPAEGKQ